MNLLIGFIIGYSIVMMFGSRILDWWDRPQEKRRDGGRPFDIHVVSKEFEQMLIEVSRGK